MNILRILIAILLVASLAVIASAQKAEITISLNEVFFDSALDAIFKNGGPMEFSIADRRPDTITVKGSEGNAFGFAASAPAWKTDSDCSETIKLLREVNGVRTAVRFRDGKILAPIAFSGSYDPPFVGCIPFSGWAESIIDLEFDPAGQRLIARAKVLNVSLNGTGGVGGSVIARLVQSSVDKKINPVELIKLDKLSFPLPLKGGQPIEMKAVNVRSEVVNGAVNITIEYDFLKV